MKTLKTYSKVLPVLVSYLFILLFVYAAVSKLIDHSQFYNDLRNSIFFGSPVVSKIISWGIPVIELGTAILLTIPKFNKIGLYASLILMIGFTLYIGGTLLMNELGIAALPCSCGGVISHLSWLQHLLFNTFCVLLGIFAIYLGTDKNKPINPKYKNGI